MSVDDMLRVTVYYDGVSMVLDDVLVHDTNKFNFSRLGFYILRRMACHVSCRVVETSCIISKHHIYQMT
jgi:hypothetical protein